MADNKMKITIIEIFALLILIGILIGITLESFDVSGATNLTTVTKVYVGNSPPNLSRVIVEPSPINLIAGNVTLVNCTGYAWDFNGWQDINITNSTFYDSSVSSNDAVDDKNYHYTNSSCANCTQVAGSTTNATCSCFFNAVYYANNGTNWLCNMTILDKGGNSSGIKIYFNSTRNSSAATINPLLGIDVPAQIDYGPLSITEISAFIAKNVTNYGNIPINVSIRGWGGDNESIPWAGNYSMFCEQGNISVDLERYSLNTTVTFANMTNLTNTSTQIPDFALWARTNDTAYGNDTNTTYWKLEIPNSVAGNCNGTVEFLAIQRI